MTWDRIFSSYDLGLGSSIKTAFPYDFCSNILIDAT